jgi:hypothetical protein
MWEKHPWEPVRYDEILKIRTNEELRLMFGDASDDAQADEDIPY